MVHLSKAQRKALYRAWVRNDQGLSYKAFRRTVQPCFGDKCVIVQWSGMWLGIEADGYTHS